MAKLPLASGVSSTSKTTLSSPKRTPRLINLALAMLPSAADSDESELDSEEFLKP